MQYETFDNLQSSGLALLELALAKWTGTPAGAGGPILVALIPEYEKNDDRTPGRLTRLHAVTYTALDEDTVTADEAELMEAAILLADGIRAEREAAYKALEANPPTLAPRADR